MLAVALKPTGPPTFKGFLNMAEMILITKGRILQCHKIADKAETTIMSIKPENIKIFAKAGSITSNGFGAPSAR